MTSKTSSGSFFWSSSTESASWKLGLNFSPMGLISFTLLLEKAFSNSNVKEINPIGEKFNPNFHEALSVLEDQKKDPDEVLEVIQKGYLIEDRVIRPALVVVNKI